MPAPMPATVLVANPTADVYGSDLQLLESVAALHAHGWRVVVAVPRTGPLTGRLEAAGAEVEVLPFPVLRRSAASPAGAVSLAAETAGRLPSMRALLRRERPALLYANTITLPAWLAAARTSGVAALCHAHEAESADRLLVQRALAGPLLLADRVVANSRTTRDALCAAVPALGSRTHVVHNGVSGPPAPPAPRARHGEGPFRVAVVGRLSPRKDPRTALEAVAVLRRRGYDVRIELCGTPVPGQEWYVDQLVRRAARPDLAGAVELAGYTAPVWPALARADVLLAPSLGESLGNAVIEAQLAGRPVVATAVQGHLESVVHDVSGVLVPVGEPEVMAGALERLLTRPDLAARLAQRGERSAAGRFGVARYHRAIVEAVSGTIERSRRQRPARAHAWA